jgi:hypothetical protein
MPEREKKEKWPEELFVRLNIVGEPTCSVCLTTILPTDGSDVPYAVYVLSDVGRARLEAVTEPPSA